MRAEKYRQFVLHADGDSEMVCWLKDDAQLRIGRRLTLKGDPDDRVWYVWLRYSTLLESPPERRWQVGGLP